MTPEARFQTTNIKGGAERFSNGITINMMRATEAELLTIASNYRSRLTDATFDYQIAQDYLDRRFPAEFQATQPLGELAIGNA